MRLFVSLHVTFWHANQFTYDFIASMYEDFNELGIISHVSWKKPSDLKSKYFTKYASAILASSKKAGGYVGKKPVLTLIT